MYNKTIIPTKMENQCKHFLVPGSFCSCLVYNAVPPTSANTIKINNRVLRPKTNPVQIIFNNSLQYLHNLMLLGTLLLPKSWDIVTARSSGYLLPKSWDIVTARSSGSQQHESTALWHHPTIRGIQCTQCHSCHTTHNQNE